MVKTITKRQKCEEKDAGLLI